MNEESMHNEEALPEVEQLEKEKKQYLEGWKRERADFLNYKKEEQERQKSWMAYATEKIVKDLLPVLDSLERAEVNISKEDKKNKTVQGLLQNIAQLKSFLKKQGVQEVEARGQFNPELHEAVAQEEREGVESGEILEVLEKGYELHGKLIRAPRVKIAK